MKLEEPTCKKKACQPRLHTFQQREIGGKARRFNVFWFDDYKYWLEYSNDLRNKMSDQFMNDCLVSYIENDRLDCISNDVIIEYFRRMKPRHYCSIRVGFPQFIRLVEVKGYTELLLASCWNMIKLLESSLALWWHLLTGSTIAESGIGSRLTERYKHSLIDKIDDQF
ncbi:hypothetical protein LXL04_019160 [Taraxacum kok-saghyz]